MHLERAIAWQSTTELTEKMSGGGEETLTMFSLVGICRGFVASSVSITMSWGWYPKFSVKKWFNNLAVKDHDWELADCKGNAGCSVHH